MDRLQHAGDMLAARQEMGGHTRGNVPPWPGSGDGDFHGTLSAICVWSQGQNLLGDDRYSLNITSAWGFVESNWSDFIPRSLGAHASDEAAYDCAMVLRAWMAGDGHKVVDDESARRERVASAARLLGAYVTDLESLSGREFKDPGFLAWTLGEYARAANDRGLGATARRFVDGAFGMKSPAPFAAEFAAQDGLFDFSCTTATRVLAVIGAEGPIPFVGALRPQSRRASCRDPWTKIPGTRARPRRSGMPFRFRPTRRFSRPTSCLWTSWMNARKTA
jgi:hypothetical protein